MELKLFQMRTVSIYTNNLSVTNKNKKSTASSRRSGNMFNFSKQKIHYLIKNMNIKTLF